MKPVVEENTTEGRRAVESGAVERPSAGTPSAAGERPSQPVPRAGRPRWLRFSLRTVLLVTTAAACWTAWTVEQARRQSRVVEWLEGNGAWVTYDYQLDESGRRIRDAAPPAPAWARERLGEDFFRRVVQVRWTGQQAPPDVREFRQVRQLRKLQLIWLPKGVGDEHLAALARMPRLEQIHAEDSGITDRGLRSLTTLPRLKYLTLIGSEVTDEGLRILATVHNLEELSVSGSAIRGPGLRYLARLPRLDYLDISYTEVKDEHLASLPDYSSLEELDLPGSITDGGMRHIVEMPHLHTLGLYNAQVTDSGIDPIVRAGRLQRLSLFYTYVSERKMAWIEEQHGEIALSAAW